ncbi:MAG: bifunctional phosphoglucose/phosphomannose isomerase [Candidatus Moraniibacteriota bacterium]|nr:MAG: bifunctional phosphoglucose/phosphomannose isomerase [Candidatus Moranbacteria bacterium]
MENREKDPSNMRKVILEEYAQFQEGFCTVDNATKEIIPLVKPYKRILVFGMGGSALPCDITDIYIRDAAVRLHFPYIPFSSFRSYETPLESSKETLHIICSHSGNTEETLSALEVIAKKGFPLIGVSSGGTLERRCLELDIPFVKLPIPFLNFQPRMASGHFFSVLIGILIRSGILPEILREEILSEAKNMQQCIENQEMIAKEIGESLKGKTPIIYSSERFRALAMTWKIKINENAKTPAFWNYFPELNHNEMVGFTYPQAEFSFFLLRDEDEDPRILRRFEVFSQLMKKAGREVKIIDISGNTVYSKLFSTLSFGDWVSYYLALAYDIDPTPVDMVEAFKKML